ncbi:MAG: hypothetical protein JWO38_347 [Gemmataceae bacterium]|nr:hypothetical protein [Gemmataceae bacterium]
MTVRYLAVATAIAGMLCLGCSGSEQVTYPVEFQVQVQGKPAVGATVVLHPVGSGDPKTPRPTGKVGESGTVKLSTFAQDDGAPPGEYTVTVDWREEKTVTVGSDQIKDFSPDKLKGRYSRPDGTTAPRVTVEKKPNQLPPLQL